MSRIGIHRRHRGFTLVEMIVALSLLAMLMTTLLWAFRSLAHAADRLAQTQQATEDMRLVAGWLRNTLASALPPSPRWWADPVPTADGVVFVGYRDSVSWTGNLPAREGVGGIHRITVRRLPVADSSWSLQLQLAPFIPAGARTAPGHHEDRLLLTGLSRITFAYRGVGDNIWHPSWQDASGLPAHIRIVLEGPQQIWPPLIVALASARHIGDRR